MFRRGSRRCTRGVVATLVTLLCSAGVAAAQSKTVTLDAVTLEPSRITGFARLRAYVSALTQEGEIIEFEPNDLKLEVSGSSLRAPRGIGRFGLSDAELAVVVIIESAFEYTSVLPLLQEVVVSELLAKLPERARVAVVGYGESVQSGKLGPLKAGKARLASLSADLGPSEPALIESVEHALGLFRRFKSVPPGRPMRKVIVLLSDGRDRTGDRDRITQVGQRAFREGARILTLAFSPSNSRRPLLNLGELSRQSRGTFRWVRTGDRQAWQAQLQRVREQIVDQLVLTYFVEDGEDDVVAGKRARIVAKVGSGELTSNEQKIPAPSCGKETCAATQWCFAGGCVAARSQRGRGLIGWLLLLLGGAAIALITLGGIGYAMARRSSQSPTANDGQPGVPGAGGTPGSATGAYPPGSRPPSYHGSAPSVPAAVAVTGPSLYIASGPRTGQRVVLFHGFTIGKAPLSALPIDDGYSSTHHAQIAVDDRGYCTIYDLGSTNGTYVNGVRITSIALEHGATVRIGATELRFLSE
jgi:FHA domain